MWCGFALIRGEAECRALTSWLRKLSGEFVCLLDQWDQMRARIKGDGESPMLYVFKTCRDFIRTVPALQHDPDRSEDLDTAGEDHAADECRYAYMSRPYIALPALPPKPKPQDNAILHVNPGGQIVYSAPFDIREWAENRHKKRQQDGDWRDA